jgi:hypothetical protein
VRRALIVLCCGAGLSALAADGLEKWKISPIELEEPLFAQIMEGDVGFVPGHPTLKALPKEARVAVVNAAGAAARAWVKSDAFKKRYDDWRSSTIPQPPTPPRTRAQLLKEAKDELAHQKKEFEASMKDMPQAQAKDVQQLRAQLETSHKMLLAHAQSPDAEAQDKLRYDSELKSWNEANERNPKDPMVRVKSLLEQFVEETKDVDFAAPLKPDGTFKAELYEEKGALWKAAYRAGPDATKAARAFALQWLKELK